MKLSKQSIILYILICIVFFLWLIYFFCSNKPIKTTDTFTLVNGIPMLNGQPFHPGVFWELRTWLSDLHPRVLAVDVDGCQESNKYHQSVTISGQAVRFADPELMDRGFFEYRFLGKLQNGIHVFQVFEKTGGTLSYHTLDFVRFTRQPFLHNGKGETRLSMQYLGCQPLHGGEVVITANQVVLTSTQPPYESQTLDLSGY